MSEKYITTLDGKLKKIIIEKDKNIKQQVYKLLRDNNYSLTLGKLYYLFDIEREDERENRAIYLRRLFFQYIKEEVR